MAFNNCPWKKHSCENWVKSWYTTRAKNGAIDTLMAAGQSVRRTVYVRPTLQLSAKKEHMGLLFPMAESKSLAKKPLTFIVTRALPAAFLFIQNTEGVSMAKEARKYLELGREVENHENVGLEFSRALWILLPIGVPKVDVLTHAVLCGKRFCRWLVSMGMGTHAHHTHTHVHTEPPCLELGGDTRRAFQDITLDKTNSRHLTLDPALQGQEKAHKINSCRSCVSRQKAHESLGTTSWASSDGTSLPALLNRRRNHFSMRGANHIRLEESKEHRGRILHHQLTNGWTKCVVLK